MGHPELKVAVITGGAGGAGLAVAQALGAQGGWQIHLVDVKEKEGLESARSLPDTTFHKADLASYEQLSAAFQAAFRAGGRRMDFVHANGGIFERSNMYEMKSDTDDPPPQPDFTSIEVNLVGTINTVHLARHFMLRSPQKGSIVITGSCSSVWPTYFAPIYTASKFGLLGFMRTIAGHYEVSDGIRVNAVLPGAMRTTMVPDWSGLPDDVFTPLERIAEVVLQLAAGKEDIVDAKGVRVPASECYGIAVVANGLNFYVHEEPAYCDDIMARTIGSTKGEKQAGLIMEGREKKIANE